MPIVQVPVNFSNEIAKGLANGSLELGGLVVRNAAGAGRGQIVKHVPLAGEKVAGAAKDAVQVGAKAVQANPALAIGIGVGAALIGATGTIVSKQIKKSQKKHRKRNKYVPPEIKSFWHAVKEYKKAGENGTMTETEIKNVIKALDNIDNSEHRNYLWRQLRAKDMYDLFKTMQDYSERLAKANGVAAFKVPENKIKNTNNIIDIRPALRESLRVFEMAG